MLQVSFTTTLTQSNLLAFFPRNIPLSLLDLTTPDNVSLASPLSLPGVASSLPGDMRYSLVAAAIANLHGAAALLLDPSGAVACKMAAAGASRPASAISGRKSTRAC